MKTATDPFVIAMRMKHNLETFRVRIATLRATSIDRDAADELESHRAQLDRQLDDLMDGLSQ